LIDQEDLAITHYHYQSISQFLKRMDRYTDIQAKELNSEGKKFTWIDLLKIPLGEFLGRFFANKGYREGLHGLALSLLQSFSFLIVYLKLWELQKFEEQSIDLNELKAISHKSGKEVNYWLNLSTLSKNPFKKILQKGKNKIIG
jgi:hypothetical protein